MYDYDEADPISGMGAAYIGSDPRLRAIAAQRAAELAARAARPQILRPDLSAAQESFLRKVEAYRSGKATAFGPQDIAAIRAYISSGRLPAYPALSSSAPADAAAKKVPQSEAEWIAMGKPTPASFGLKTPYWLWTNPFRAGMTPAAQKKADAERKKAELKAAAAEAYQAKLKAKQDAAAAHKAALAEAAKARADAAAAKHAALVAAADAKAKAHLDAVTAKKAAADAAKAAKADAAAAKKAAAAEKKAAQTAYKMINVVTVKQAQNMIVDGGTWVDAPAGLPVTRSDAFLSYNGVIYRSNFLAKLPTAKRIADIRTGAAQAVAAGASPQAAAAAAVAQDSQQNPGQPLMSPGVSASDAMAITQPAAQAGGQVLAAQPTSADDQAWLTPYSTTGSAAVAELVDEGDQADVETQDAAGAVEAQSAERTGEQVAEQAEASPEVAEQADAEAPSAPEEPAGSVPAGGGGAMLPLVGAAAAAFLMLRGFEGMGEAEKVKVVARKAAKRALASGASPQAAIALARKVAARCFMCPPKSFFRIPG